MNRHPTDWGSLPPDEFDANRFCHAVSRPLPLFRVVLHNQPDQNLAFVIQTVMDLTRFCRTEATHKMWQAYYEGTSAVIVTHLERAELFEEMFAERGLHVELEPV